MVILNKLKNLDAYPKINEDFHSRTLSGGVITVVSSIIIFFLFVSETRLFLYSATESRLIVDASRGERLQINFDVTFPSVACSLLSVDMVDISGEQHYDIRHDIIKKRLDHLGNVIESKQGGIGAPKQSNPLAGYFLWFEFSFRYYGLSLFVHSTRLKYRGFDWIGCHILPRFQIERPLQKHGGRLDQNEPYCGTCYGAEDSDDQCCNSCEEVQEAYRKKGWAVTNVDLIDQCSREGFFRQIKDEKGEGCNIHGLLDVSKVAGNFHFSVGKSIHQSGIHTHDFVAVQTESYNISHKINKLSFGKEFPGVVNPLDRAQWNQGGSSGMYQYFIKVVPTIYQDMRGHKIQSNQFSVTDHFRDGNVHPNHLPGVYFFYDFSPIKVIFTEENRSFLHYLTQLCAIVGGVFTVSGIIDAFVYHGNRTIKKKRELGKYR